MTTEHAPQDVTPRRAATLSPIPTDYARLELLYEIQAALVQPRAIAAACDAILPIVTRALHVRSVVLLDVTGDVLRALTWGAAGVAPEELEHAHHHARAMLENLVRSDLPAATELADAGVLVGGTAEPAMQPRHFVTLPLLARVHSPLFGVFQVEGARRFDEHDLLFINAVVNQLAVALDRHHTDHQLEVARVELEQANRRLTDLQALSHAALAGETVDESLAAVLRALCPMFDVDIAAVLLATGDGSVLRRRASVGLVEPAEVELAIGRGASGRIAAQEAAMFFDNLTDLDDLGPTLRANRIRWLLGAPMRARKRLIGVVYVASREDRQFRYDELRLIELVADRIGMIIENARLYAHALAAVRSRDAVMGVVSHDLRNPLSAIHLSTQLFPRDDPAIAKPVSIISRSVDVMARLVSDLRDVSSIEAGRLSIKTANESACQLVRDAVEDVQDAASKSSLRIQMQLPAEDLIVECDRVRIVQVLTNLLSNAIKFTPAGGAIAVALIDLGDRACFSITDTGCGIPDSDLLHVFDRYWQAALTAHLGTGLGLAIAKAIVEAHGGTMSVASSIGRGSTFTFTLYRARPTPPPAA